METILILCNLQFGTRKNDKTIMQEINLESNQCETCCVLPHLNLDSWKACVCKGRQEVMGDLWLNTKLLWLGKPQQNNRDCSRSRDWDRDWSLFLGEGEFEIPHVDFMYAVSRSISPAAVVDLNGQTLEWEHKWSVRVLTMCCIYATVTARNLFEMILCLSVLKWFESGVSTQIWIYK